MLERSQSSSEQHSILVVDDHAGFRTSARLLLESQGFTVVGEVGDGASALAAVARLRPHAVLLDVQLPDIDGFEVAERLAAGEYAPKVVLVSSRDRHDFGPLIEAAPVRGFLDKSDLSAEALAELLG